MSTPPVLVIVGATATGKSALAVDVARHLGAEVVNTDSMQLYRGMDIGTGKLIDGERHGVVHHLLDVWPVTHTATVVEFRELVYETLDDCRLRDVPAVLVGGSGMYVQAVVDGWSFPGTDPSLRTVLEERLKREGASALHAELAQRDPAAAALIQPTNARRVVRALEVVTMQGSFQASLPGFGTGGALECTLVGLSLPRAELDARIEQRVEQMWQAGWVDEVRELAQHGLRDGLTASRALGYRQILKLLDGDITESEARDQTIRATRRFARRQESWFRRDPRVHWLSATAQDLTKQVLTVLAASPGTAPQVNDLG